MKSIRAAFAAALGLGLLATSIHAQAGSPESGKVLPPRSAITPPRKNFIGTPPPEWGTTAVSWYRLGAAELAPDTSGTTYTSLWSPVSSYVYQRYVTSGFPHLIGFAHLPGGSVLDAWQFSYCDTSSGPTHMTISLYSCDDLGTCGAPPVYSFDTGTVGPACWSTQISGGPFGFTVDNKTSEYMVDVVFGTLDGSQTIASTSFGYRLQVSPGPGSATFNDVPVSDPAFQYVEALVASGITAGCGAGNYCPDSPVTRRQMAVFIAKALGLNWTDY